jgi:hypothetical protein
MAAKILRTTKTLRLIKYAIVFKHIFNTLVLAIPLVVNIGSLLLLLHFIYTIAGVMLFGRVQRNGAMTQNLNFESFEKGAYTLFVISTTDNYLNIIQSFL